MDGTVADVMTSRVLVVPGRTTAADGAGLLAAARSSPGRTGRRPRRTRRCGRPGSSACRSPARAAGLQRLPVAGPDGRLAGVISWEMLLTALRGTRPG